MNVGTLFASLALDSRGFEKALDGAGIKLGKFGKVAGLALASLAIGVVGAIAGSASAAIDFESAFAGVRKTVDATETQFAELESGIRTMATEMPIAAVEIAGVAEAAGQLGIKREAILGFSEVMSKLGVTTNLTADQAATSLARIANITQMPQTEFDRLGATIVALGNAGASTEAELVEMALRIAGAGKQVGMTEAEILSFANSLSSVGIEAAAGGSSISRVMIDMATNVAQGGEKLEGFARVAGMSSKEFSAAFKENAAGAIVSFIEGLGRMSDSGEDVFTVLEKLGLSEVRVRDALLRAAGAGDLFRESLELGSRAWEENTALNEEAEKRFETTASKIQVMLNRVTELAITIGTALIPIIGAVADAVGLFALGLTNAGEMVDFLKPGLIALGGIIAVVLLPATIAWATAAIAAAGAVIIAFAPVILAIAGVAAAVVGLSLVANNFAMDFGDMGDRIHDIADQSKRDFNDVKDWIKARMEETGESFEEAADAADEHFGTMSKSLDDLVLESGKDWETYQAQIGGAHDGVDAATSGMGADFEELGDTVEEETEAIAEDVETAVQLVIKSIQEAEQPVRDAGQAAADAWIDPIRTASEIAALEAELGSKELRDNLRSEDTNIVRDAQLRTREIVAELITLKNEQATQGDEAAQIARSQSLLTSDFMLEGLSSNDEEIAAVFRNWRDELQGRIADMEGAARRARIGQELRSNILSQIPSISEAAREAARAVRATFPSSEPKDPQSPLRGITSGWHFGDHLAKGLDVSLAGVNLGASLNKAAEGLSPRWSGGVAEPTPEAIQDHAEMRSARRRVSNTGVIEDWDEREGGVIVIKPTVEQHSVASFGTPAEIRAAARVLAPAIIEVLRTQR